MTPRLTRRRQNEDQDDMQINTLRRLIEALDSQLEIIAHLPRGDIRINQFKEAG